MRGGKTGLVVVGVGEGGVWVRGRCVWTSWWARSRSWVCSKSDDRVMSWLEFDVMFICVYLFVWLNMAKYHMI